MSSSVDDFLEHYGVKGQKWGVRRRRSTKDTKVIAKRKQISAKRRHLSDGDLKKYIERLNEEKKLKTLVAEDLTPGRAATKKIMSESGQKVARTVISGAALYAVKVALDKSFDRKDAASYVAPRPKK